MNKIEHLALAVTIIFCMCWIGSCCVDAKESLETDSPIFIEDTENGAIDITADSRFEALLPQAEKKDYAWDSLNIDPGNVFVIENRDQICVVEPAMEHVVETTDAVELEPIPTPEPEPAMIYYSAMEVTAYVATGNPCADGVYPCVGYTVACNDPALWHRWIYIEGIGDRYVHDTGGMASNVIDLFVGSYDEAILFGRQVRGVYIYE